MSVRRIIVFGATGGTGRALVQQALDRDQQVTAFVRDPERLPIQHEQLRILIGDVLQSQTIPAALRDQDAVRSGPKALRKRSRLLAGYQEYYVWQVR